MSRRPVGLSPGDELESGAFHAHRLDPPVFPNAFVGLVVEAVPDELLERSAGCEPETIDLRPRRSASGPAGDLDLGIAHMMDRYNTRERIEGGGDGLIDAMEDDVGLWGGVRAGNRIGHHAATIDHGVVGP